jgi:hypothetical protein
MVRFTPPPSALRITNIPYASVDTSFSHLRAFFFGTELSIDQLSTTQRRVLDTLKEAVHEIHPFFKNIKSALASAGEGIPEYKLIFDTTPQIEDGYHIGLSNDSQVLGNGR